MAQNCIRQNFSMRQEDIDRIDELSRILNLSKSEVIRLATIALADHIRLEKKMMEITTHNVQCVNKKPAQDMYNQEQDSSSEDILFSQEMYEIATMRVGYND